MGTLKVKLTTGKSAQTLTRDYERSVSAKYADVQAIADLVESILSGNQTSPVVNVSVQENETAASGTVTAAAAQAADTVTINGVVFTAVSGAPAANQFDISGSNTAAATSLAAAINASATALVSGYVSAVSALAVVTISSLFPGIAGNQVTLASSNNTRLAVSAARLTGGAVDPTAKTYSF